MWLGLSQEEIINLLVKLLTAALGTLGFGLLFKAPPSKLPIAVMGGLFTYAVYAFAELFGCIPLVAAFASSVFMTLYSEIFARIKKTPAVMFLLPCAIPIVPGSGLYYTVYNLIFYNESALISHCTYTLQIILGIALGFGIGVTAVSTAVGVGKYVRAKKCK